MAMRNGDRELVSHCQVIGVDTGNMTCLCPLWRESSCEYDSRRDLSAEIAHRGLQIELPFPLLSAGVSSSGEVPSPFGVSVALSYTCALLSISDNKSVDNFTPFIPDPAAQSEHKVLEFPWNH